MICKLLLAVMGATVAGSGMSAEVVTLESTEARVALVELFTSEGCSSCPPAEKWLSDLKAAHGLWKEFVPVAFHVDYWDYLGWRDPWGSPANSDRQRAYSQRWHKDSIYTPGLVLNGQEWRDWGRQKDGPLAPTSKAGVLKVDSADRQHWRVTFSPASTAEQGFEAHGVLLVSGLVSDVKAGENRGRQLKHDFVVTVLAACPLKRIDNKFEGELECDTASGPRSLPRGFAVWVTPLGRLEPAQATGGWLAD